MDYQFENLNPERFQQFCQSLLVKEFPDVQCFPVAQPDGGRDAVMYYPTAEMTNEYIVFQVKFVRNPHSIADPHKWLLDILRNEAPKVKSLLKKGAKGYYLITNIPGTAHPDTGSIDKALVILNHTLGIPCRCWWRDDLSRRLDNAWDLKWVYPEVMTGTDMLRAIIESELSEAKGQRSLALRTFIKRQYEADKEVRFKQIDLQNGLLDLFIDVPISIEAIHHTGGRGERWQEIPQILYILSRHYDNEILDSVNIRSAYEDVPPSFTYSEREMAVGAASLLLNPIMQERIPQIVLEGAPGQGKSTLAQYICQAHRMYILGLRNELNKLPKEHRPVSVRIPFRIDLRDFATWLNKQDPFSSEEHGMLPQDWRKSLEAFLAALVRHHSGGLSFSVDDLHAIAKIGALLLVFDGFDEVADLAKREEIVNEVIAGVSRLRESCKLIQVIVTSRPAAFVSSPGFPEDSFLHFELTSITRSQIYDYANRWCQARRLDSQETEAVTSILTEKLHQPHLRDLARNPMQLAILLSLIHTRGVSLPDKRTALYYNYVDLFFNREAEKSPVVREYRDLLIDIHGYLAWVLHSEAEQGHNRGSISTERLKNLLSQYLIAEGRNPSITGVLFTGMIERVVALVSRVQGTYEFEVQPLREYFAARYLADTAPYSPPGRERQGTKPDRFNAIARNFYWLNVARFYAGSYSKGEIPSLVDGLQELADEGGYKRTNHPRILASMLLSDWVFAQYPRSMQEALHLILNEEGLRYVYTTGFGGANQQGISVISLSQDCGQTELVEKCFATICTHPQTDRAHALINILKANSSREHLKKLWLAEVSKAPREEANRWWWYGSLLGILPKLTTSEISGILDGIPDASIPLRYLFRAGQLELCESSDQYCEHIIADVMNGDLQAGPSRRSHVSILTRFAESLGVHVYSSAFHVTGLMPLSEVADFTGEFEGRSTEMELEANGLARKSLDKCIEVIKVANKELQRPAKEWATELTPWNNLIETSRSVWGERWVHYKLAFLACSIRVSPQVDGGDLNLFDHSFSLCSRTLYARLCAQVSGWWKKQFKLATTEFDLMFASLMLLMWGNSDVIASLSSNLEEALDKISPNNWHRLIRSVEELQFRLNRSKGSELLAIPIESLPGSLSGRAATLLGLRSKATNAADIYLKYLAKYTGSDHDVLDFCQKKAIDLLISNHSLWKSMLEVVSMTYAANIVAYSGPQPTGSKRSLSIPLKAAEEIVMHSEKYPLSLVTNAEARCKQAVAAKLKPVAEIARRDDWFPQLYV